MFSGISSCITELNLKDKYIYPNSIPILYHPIRFLGPMVQDSTLPIPGNYSRIIGGGPCSIHGGCRKPFIHLIFFIFYFLFFISASNDLEVFGKVVSFG